MDVNTFGWKEWGSVAVAQVSSVGSSRTCFHAAFPPSPPSQRTRLTFCVTHHTVSVINLPSPDALGRRKSLGNIFKLIHVSYVTHSVLGLSINSFNSQDNPKAQQLLLPILQMREPRPRRCLAGLGSHIVTIALPVHVLCLLPSLAAALGSVGPETVVRFLLSAPGDDGDSNESASTVPLCPPRCSASWPGTPDGCRQ